MSHLTVKKLARVNRARCQVRHGFQHPIGAWTPPIWPAAARSARSVISRRSPPPGPTPPAGPLPMSPAGRLSERTIA